MHPALIPEKHPICGKYMEALVQCRKEHPYSKFVGVCSGITWDLSNCLQEEKKAVREPRLKKFQERYSAKKQENAERLEALRRQREAEAAAREGPGSQAGAVQGASAGGAGEGLTGSVATGSAE